MYCRTKWPKRSLPNIKSIDTISVRPLTAESIKKVNDSSVQDAARQCQRGACVCVYLYSLCVCKGVRVCVCVSELIIYTDKTTVRMTGQ